MSSWSASRFIVIGTEQNSSMMGIRFRPGGAHPFLPFPVSEVNNDVVDMESVWGTTICGIHEQILSIRELASRVGLSQRWAEIASDAGYYDQSHFARDFQEFTGLNPSRYLIDKQDYENFIPIR